MSSNTVRVNFTIPEKLYRTIKAIIPERQRSKVVSQLLEEEVKRREESLFKIAQAVEKDRELNKEMAEWDVTLNDGMEEIEWK